MRTWDLVAAIASRQTRPSYLQITTGTTSSEHFQNLDARAFAEVHLYLYADPGQRELVPEAARYPTLSALRSRLLGPLGLGPRFPWTRRYDLVFVDPWHSIASSKDALALARALVDPLGFLVVHDCNPATPELARTDHHGSVLWCGETYRAFLDLVVAQDRRGWMTVDDDYGMGVLLPEGLGLLDAGARARIRGIWQGAVDPASAFRLLECHRAELLRLVPPAALDAALAGACV